MFLAGRNILRLAGLVLCATDACDDSESIASAKEIQALVVSVDTQKVRSAEESTEPATADADRCSPDRAAVIIGRASRSRSEPVRTICFDRTEVTLAAYAACVEAGQCTEPKPYVAGDRYERFHVFCNWRHPEDRSSHPVNCVSIDQAQTYCATRGGRLPTDVEWKWVASNGGSTRYPWGDAAPNGTRVNGCGLECPDAVRALASDPEMRATYKQSDGYVGTAPVGSFPKGDNALGIHDLAGNVAEFVTPVSVEVQSDLVAGGSCFTRKLQHMLAAEFTHTKWRGSFSPTLGFRCVAD